MRYMYVTFTTEILSDNYHLEFLKTIVDVGGAPPFVRDIFTRPFLIQQCQWWKKPPYSVFLMV